MTTRRTLTWLILFLVAVPTVAAAADTAQRFSEGDVVIRAGDLHEGERFVYDLSYSSFFHDRAGATRDFLIIEVGHVTPLRLRDGHAYDVLPVRYEERSVPWPTEDGKARERHGTIYVRVADGATVRVEEIEKTTRYEVGPEGGMQREDETIERTVHSGTTWDAIHEDRLDGIMRPGQRFVDGNIVVQTLAFIVGVDGGEVYGKGKWRGRDVYQISDNNWWYGSDGAFVCSLSQPSVLYHDGDAYDEADGDALHHEETTGAWMVPDLALPLRSFCRSVYTQSGVLIEDVSIQLDMVEHVPGGAAVPLPERGGAVPQTAPLHAVPVLVPGLPAQGEGDWLFPTEDLLEVLRSTPRLRSFRDDGSVPFIVSSFETRLTRAEPDGAAGPDLPDPLGILPADTQTGTSDVTWRVHLQNASGWNVGLDVERRFDAGREVIDEKVDVRVSWEGSASVNGERVRATDYPTHMVPLGAAVKAWQGVAATSAEETHWVMGLDHAYHSGSAPVAVPFYQFNVLQVGATDASQEWHASSLVMRATTGHVVEQREHSRQDSQVSARPGPAPLLQSRATTIDTAAHLPTAATASGIAVALAFAVAFFWETLARLILVPFHAKVMKAKVLDHATRDKIVDFVTANPGETVSAIRRYLGAGYGTTMHHLDTLERNDLLASRKVGRVRCYFPHGHFSPATMDATAAGQTAAAKRLLETVQARPGVTQGELAQALGITDASVRYHVKRLEAHARLTAQRDGRIVRYFPGAAATA